VECFVEKGGVMRNLKNRLSFKLFLVFVVGVLLFSLIPANVFATNTEDELYIDGHRILSIYYGDGNSMQWSYWNPGPFTFQGDHNGATNYYDGQWMAVEISATSTAGAIPIYIDLFVQRTSQHHTFTIWADGTTGKFDWISLGSAGGSAANCYYYVDSQYASATNTVDVKSYSWIVE